MLRLKRITQAIIATLAILTSTGPAAAADPFKSWDLLDRVQVTEVLENNAWKAVKSFPDALRASADGFTIEGYYVPIEAQAYVSTFLLIRDPAECPFCGAGGYGPSLEVALRRPVRDLEPYTRITIRGDLELIDDTETYLAYRMRNARPVKR